MGNATHTHCTHFCIIHRNIIHLLSTHHHIMSEPATAPATSMTPLVLPRPASQNRHTVVQRSTKSQSKPQQRKGALQQHLHDEKSQRNTVLRITPTRHLALQGVQALRVHHPDPSNPHSVGIVRVATGNATAELLHADWSAFNYVCDNVSLHPQSNAAYREFKIDFAEGDTYNTRCAAVRDLALYFCAIGPTPQVAGSVWCHNGDYCTSQYCTMQHPQHGAHLMPLCRWSKSDTGCGDWSCKYYHFENSEVCRYGTGCKNIGRRCRRMHVDEAKEVEKPETKRAPEKR